jgi:hypothetical protein
MWKFYIYQMHMFKYLNFGTALKALWNSIFPQLMQIMSWIMLHFLWKCEYIFIKKLIEEKNWNKWKKSSDSNLPYQILELTMFMHSAINDYKINPVQWSRLKIAEKDININFRKRKFEINGRILMLVIFPTKFWS